MATRVLKSFSLCISKFKCFCTVGFPTPSPSAIDEQDEGTLYTAVLSEISTSNSLTSSPATAGGDESGSFFSSETECLSDFTSAVSSHRFFFPSPGSSNSILESGAVVGVGVAIRTYSPDPYSDFRKSMLEMIADRGMPHVEADWVFLHELLLCYLMLNPKCTHRFILGAFADIAVSLLQPLTVGRRTHPRSG